MTAERNWEQDTIDALDFKHTERSMLDLLHRRYTAPTTPETRERRPTSLLGGITRHLRWSM